MSAIEAEVEQLQDDSPCETVARPKRPRAGRQPLPDHLPRIEHRHEPESCTCGQCGKDLVKIGEDVTEQLDVEPAKFLSIAIFVRNTPAGPAKPSPRRRFHRR
jgi:transposase